MSDLVIPVLLLIDGLISVVLAVWAHEIGLDPNASWGLTRFILLSIGTALALVSVLMIFLRKRQDNPFTLFAKSKTGRLLLAIAHVWLLVILIYVWFITYGNWTTWGHTTNYYDQLANAFGHGRLNIDINPGAALLAAPNPYDPAHRPEFNSNAWDMSLYNGKLYVYWGPAPAVLIAPIKLLLAKPITDNMLVLFFLLGILVFNSLILLMLWRRFFGSIRAWQLLTGILLLGLVSPILWSINSPRVYEAAVEAGQFFLMGGIFFVLSAFNKETGIDRTRLFLAGLFWAGSVASRAINSLPVVFMACLVLYWMLKNMRRQMSWRVSIPEITALMTPLIIGAAAIGWYNWVRFDTPFEFGIRYQISILDLNKQSSLVFQPDYFFLNLYSYVFQPFGVLSKFPFIYPTTTQDLFDKLNLAMPQIYYVGRMTGLLFCVPFLVFSLAHFRSISRFPRETDHSDQGLSYDLVVYLLAGSFLIGFLVIMFYFFGQMRYLVDFISQITILAIMGYWKLLLTWQKRHIVTSRVFLGFANLLMISTICIGLLLAFSGDFDRMKTLNPVLFERIVNSWGIPK